MTQHILVLNSGSSSIKFQVLDLQAENPDVPFLSGLVEQIGESRGHIRIVTENNTTEDRRPILSHSVGLERAFGMMSLLGVGPQELDLCAVGHRVVHGGEEFHSPELIEGDVLDRLKALIPLAPLHNPANIDGIENAQALLPDVPHVAVFDTAFFSTLPEAAANYALNAEVAREHNIRRYGFHGTSHDFVSHRAAEVVGRPYEELRQIVLHLGNGASVTAIDGGRSVETSMGFTPLEGLVMGTRSGDIDPAALFHLSRRAGLGIDALDELLNKRSGLLGLAGRSDMRDILAGRAAGEEAATLAYDVYIHRLRAYVGAYIAQLGGVDSIAFTAGVGENAVDVRADALATLGFLGVRVDPERNAARGRGIRRISSDESTVEVLVVPTDEEHEIARQAVDLVS